MKTNSLNDEKHDAYPPKDRWTYAVTFFSLIAFCAVVAFLAGYNIAKNRYALSQEAAQHLTIIKDK